MTNTPHYFIAIPLPKGLKGFYSKWQADLKKHLDYKEWPDKADLHITLKFLGPAETGEINQLLNSLQTLEKLLTPFQIHTGSLGFFGSSNKPRVLWAGVQKTESILDLHDTVDKIALKAGFQSENRPYSPHITLAKKWTGNKLNLTELKVKYTEQQQMTINKVVVYQIFPNRKPKYQTIATYELKEEVD